MDIGQRREGKEREEKRRHGSKIKVMDGKEEEVRKKNRRKEGRKNGRKERR